MTATRWILGFDGGCGTCTNLARQIEALSEGRVTARHLREPEVHRWRTQTLGAAAPWTPTLFAVADGRVRAWRRLGMAWQLGRLLGPAKMWQVARLLGESGAPADAAPDPGRRRFLRIVGGAALGLAVLSGTKALTPLATGAQESQVTIEPADAKTREKMLKQARSDKRVRKLHERLLADGFSPAGEPVVAVGRQNGVVHRTVVVTDYRGGTAGLTATLVFGVEAQGEDPWAYASVLDNGKPSLALTVTSNGAIEVTKAEDVVVPAQSFECTVCLFLCGGACALGCGVACAYISRGVPPLFWICLGVCGVVCVAGGCAYINPCYDNGFCP